LWWHHPGIGGCLATPPGLCTINASSPSPPVMTTQNVSRCCQISFWSQNHPRLRIICLMSLWPFLPLCGLSLVIAQASSQHSCRVPRSLPKR
jgi:hypothetical protein